MKKIQVKIKENSKIKATNGFLRILISIISLFSLLLICLNIFLYNDVKNKKLKIVSLNSELSQNKNYKSLYEDINSRFDNINSKNSDILNFYDDYVVIVPNNENGCYHQYGCYDSITSSGKFKVYYLEEAQQLGYKSCPKCINHEN